MKAYQIPCTDVDDNASPSGADDCSSPVASSPTISRSAFLIAAVAIHGPQLMRFFALRLPDPSEAPDLVQEVYLRILKVERPDLIHSPKAYLYTVAANIAREHWLKRSARPPHVRLDDVGEEGLLAEAHVRATTPPEDAVAMVESLESLGRILEPLSPKVRAALIWAHRDGHTYEEISARLAIPKHRVKKYLAKALAHCRNYLPLFAES